MKVIKKYFKVALCFMAFALLSVAFAVNPSVSVYGALQNAGSMAFGELKATKMPSSVNAAEGEEFVVPALKDKTTPYTIRVYDTAGQYHDFVMNDNNAENDTTYFTAVTAGVKVNVLNNGTYRVVYIVDGVYSNTYRVKVTNVSYELDFVDANNMKALVKPTVAVLDDETDFNNWIKLPTPTVNKINGEETTTTTNSAVVKVTLDGTTISSVEFVSKGDTPSFVDNCDTADFLGQFAGQDVKSVAVDTVSGATKSSESVLSAVYAVSQQN